MVFSLSKKEIGLTDLYTHHIKLKDDKTIISKNRPIPLHKFTEFKEMMTDLIEMRVLEPSMGKHRSPLILVTKKDETSRFCVDYRELNRHSGLWSST